VRSIYHNHDSDGGSFYFCEMTGSVDSRGTNCTTFLRSVQHFNLVLQIL